MSTRAIQSSAEELSDMRAPSMWQLSMRSRRVVWGGGALLLIVAVCVGTIPLTLIANKDNIRLYSAQELPMAREKPTGSVKAWFGYDNLGRSLLARTLLGGTISLAVGLAAATIAVVLGVTVGLVAGYRGGWIDSLLMRLVDVLYGLPYVLLIILFKVAFQGRISKSLDSPQAASLLVLFSAIGLVSWLTMARVVRGQVLSLRAQPFVEACRAMGIGETRIFLRHILPNLVGPITVYATLTVPSAILQESFLSFLGVGIEAPLPSWGSLASEAVTSLSPIKIYWWMLVYPCTMLVVTLLSLNFLGDGLRDVFDPKRDAAKI